MLPKPKDNLGYSDKEIVDICIERDINPALFWRRFGVNTIGVAKDGTSRYYQCDVERTLYDLGKKDGKFYMWD